MEHDELEPAAVARLGDLELMAGLRGLVARDRVLTARLLVHLGEVDARGLFREQAFSSMFEYCVEALHMSPDEAYVRLRVAKLAREFPVVVPMLERNELHLSAIKLLAPHLTAANHVAVLERARGKSKRAVELMQVRESASRYVPRAVVREVCARDEERCTFVSPEGRRCAALGFLELHHDVPYAHAGLPTVENMKILCRAHNGLLAERDFGRAFMQSRAQRARRRRLGPGTVCNLDP